MNTHISLSWQLLLGSMLVFYYLSFLPFFAYASHTPEWTNLNESDPGITLPKPPAEERGEKGGTADINIGVGELWEEENETDLDILRERARRLHDDVLQTR